MADNEYNDEYQFDEFETFEPDTGGGKEPGSTEPVPKPSKPRGEGGSKIIRNAIIVVVLVALLMLGYKFFGSFFSAKEQPAQEKPSIPSATEAPPQSPPPVSIVQPLKQPPPTPVQNTAPVQPSVDSSQIDQKLASVEVNQQNIRSDVSTVNSKLNGINSNVNQLNEKIANLSQMLTSLATKLEQQSTEIAFLTERTKPKPIRRIVVKGRSGSIYFVQAIIPGRAWLIATNGSTITVREGTHIPGYGEVKLIDPNQGRVVTSSGQVIRFSQQDS